ncbi:MAG TPA: hydroxymethylbilane synthase [Candidatus Binatia bacterium]|jgi:hydroxymethylbilane synthase
MTLIRIGTRGSALALAQTEWVKRRLEERDREIRVEVVKIKTSGDRFLASPTLELGKGIFVKEIEDALLEKKIDLAVHSMKDLPTVVTRGLSIAAVPEREDARDALVTRARASLGDLPRGAKIGTGSLRRRAQVLNRRADIVVAPIRGNVDTRLRKMAGGEVDGLVMAAAGLKRLGLADRIGEYLPTDVCLPAPAQGALALQARDGDRAIDVVAFLRHSPTMLAVTAERALLEALGGGCQLPVGALASVSGAALTLSAVVADPDGRRLLREEQGGRAEDAERIGIDLAERLLTQGARKLLSSGN